MATDPFARTIEVIDRELHDQVERRHKGVDEILHGCFLIERADTVIERLIEERLMAQAKEAQKVAG